jgi:hypothetical protein
LPQNLGQEFKDRFSEELVKNVFRDTKRSELSLNEADIIEISRSDRGYSIDDTNNSDAFMKLKKTTVLTGNHASKQPRDRA